MKRINGGANAREFDPPIVYKIRSIGTPGCGERKNGNAQATDTKHRGK